MLHDTEEAPGDGETGERVPHACIDWRCVQWRIALLRSLPRSLALSQPETEAGARSVLMQMRWGHEGAKTAIRRGCNRRLLVPLLLRHLGRFLTDKDAQSVPLLLCMYTIEKILH